MALTKANETVVSLTDPTFAGTTTLTGQLQLVSGSTSLAPMKFGGVTPAILTTPQANAFEYDGTSLFLTNTSATRKSLPFSDGTNASGTWGISITGNAATVNNGVYTTGSYSNPTWLTSLDGSKITGTISVNCANITAYPLDQSVAIAGTPRFASLGIGTAASGVTGEIRATNDITAYYSSDIRLKENVRTIDNALSLVKRLNGVRFDWKDDYIEDRGGEDGYFIRKNDIGVIAQDVESVFPELVGTRNDGTKAVKYDRLVAVLIQAIKELDDKVSKA